MTKQILAAMFIVGAVIVTIFSSGSETFFIAVALVAGAMITAN